MSKKTLHRYRSFNDDPDLLNKVLTGDESCVKPKPNHPDGSVQKNLDRKKHVEFGQMRSFCSLFASIAIMLCIMNPCHKIVRLISYAPISRSNSSETHWIVEKPITHATAHTSKLVREFLAKNKTIIMLHSPYSPHLEPAAFLLFPKLKTPMKVKCFATIEEIKEKSKQKLLAIVKSAFQKCFKDWKKRWHKWFISEGRYFEGDKIVIDK